jgi:hypothetical protein
MTTTETRAIPAVGRLGVTAAALVEALRHGKPGDTYTDEQLQAICGKATGAGEPGYGALCSAINHVRTNNGRVWQRIRSAGAIRCLDPDETVVNVGSDMRSLRLRARRAASKLQTVDTAKIKDPENKTKAMVLGAMFGAIRAVSSTGTLKSLGVRTQQLQTPSAADVLAMFTPPAPKKAKAPPAAPPAPPPTPPAE